MQTILVAMLLGLAVENNLVSSGLYLFWELIVPGANRDFLLVIFFFLPLLLLLLLLLVPF